MFSGLTQGSLVYILDKTKDLKYKVGEVVGITHLNLEIILLILVNLILKLL